MKSNLSYALSWRRPLLLAAVVMALAGKLSAQSLALNVPQNGPEGTTLFAAGLVVLAQNTNLSPVTVQLFSFNTDRVRVPPSVILPPGSNTVTFDLELVDNDWLDGAENVVIEAWHEVLSGDLDVIRVHDDESRAFALALPAAVVEGAGTLTNAGLISFFGRPLTNVVLALQSNHPELVAVPAFVTNFAGQTGAWFHVTVAEDTVTNVFNSVSITASAPGFLGATGTVNRIDDEPFVPVHPVPSDQASQVSLLTTLRWTVNPAAPPGTSYDVYFGSSPTLGEAEFLGSTASNGWVLPPLPADATCFWQIKARTAGTTASPVWRFTTRGVSHFAFGAVNSPQLAEASFPITLTARDELNRVVTNFTGAAGLGVLADGDGSSNSILPSPVHNVGYTMSIRTVGYSFTPNTNILVTAVRHYFGSKVSIWSDDGALLASQPVTSGTATWRETPLAAPLLLNAGTRYRVSCYISTSFHYSRNDGAPTFADGTIHQSYSLNSNDGFPTNASPDRWWLVDLRYNVATPPFPPVAGPFANGVWIGNITVSRPAANSILKADDSAGHTGESNPFRVLPADQPLAILTQPLGQTVGPATPVSLAVAVDGVQPLSYQWRRNGVNLTDDGRVNGTTAPILNMASAVEDDSGIYSLVVSNAFANITSSNAVLTVRPVSYFAWAPIPSPQFPNVPFAVTIEARNFLNQIAPGFTGVVALSTLSGAQFSLTPTNSEPFTNGVWSGFMTFTNPATNLILRAAAAGQSGLSHSIDIVPTEQPPVIWSQPVSQPVRLGSNVTLVVKAFGAAPMTYQWRRGGTNVSESGRVSGTAGPALSVAGFMENDGGIYSVIVSNEFGTATSSNITLTLNLVEHFTWSHIHSPRGYGTLIPVIIQARGVSNQIVTNFSGPVAFSGLAGGRDVPVSPTVSANFTNGVWAGNLVIFSTATNLVLRADDGAGQTGASNPFHVAFTGQTPIFLTHPVSQSVRAGDTVVFSVDVYAAPPLDYRWQTNGVPVLGSVPRFSGINTNVLTISNVVAGDSGTISMRVFGNEFVFSSNATLFVNPVSHFVWRSIPTPHSRHLPIPVTVEARDFSNRLTTNFTGTVMISASIGGSGALIPVSPSVSASFVTGVWSGSLTITQGVSNVVLSALSGLADSGVSAPFDVINVAAFTLQPVSQFVLPGTNVTLAAAAAGEGTIRYQWRFEGTNLPGATNASLSFTNARLANHHGNFSVVVSDAAGSITSSNAFIYVLVRPGLVTAPRPVTVLQGATAVFTCVATGAPPLAFRWLSNSVPFTTSSVPFLVLSNVQPRVPPVNFRVIVQNTAGATAASASTNVALIVLADFDQDGMADAWESSFGFSTNDSFNALLDADGDGLGNRAEYLAGTDPTDAASVLKIFLTGPNAGVLQFIAQSNVAYSVEQRTNLSFESWSAFTSLAAQAFVRTVQVGVPYPPTGPARYYRLVTPPGP